MSVTIEKVETKKQLVEFIKVPWMVYRDDPNWVPWLYFERLEFFDKKRNPFFEYAEADYFLARRDGKPVGTVAAILNHNHNEFHDENVAHFGVFELLNDPEAAALLLETACNWAKERGAEKILGPMSLSTKDEIGMLIEGFDKPPVVIIPYNLPYYMGFMEPNGFSKAMDLYSWDIDLEARAKPGGMPEKVVRIVERLRKKMKISLRTINMKDWDAEVERMIDIYHDAWEKNWGFVPWTDAEGLHFAKSHKSIVDPDIIFIIEKEGEPVGFALCIPDVNIPLVDIRPGPSIIGSYFGGVRMLLNKKKAYRMRVPFLGISQKIRHAGLGALLYYELIMRGAAAGYTRIDGSWVLETNDPMNNALALFGGEIHKKHRIYEKEL